MKETFECGEGEQGLRGHGLRVVALRYIYLPSHQWESACWANALLPFKAAQTAHFNKPSSYFGAACTSKGGRDRDPIERSLEV